LKGTPTGKGRDERAEEIPPDEASLIAESEDDGEAPEPAWHTEDPAFFIKDSDPE
jgi:hypothetical protein